MSVTIDGGTGSVALTATASGASLGTTLIVPAGSAGAPSVVATGDTNTGVFFPAADTVALATSGTERLRVPSSGGVQAVTTISVGNATPSTSGAGITFPATQSASTDANTLDDYEEGTWTPVIGGSGGQSGQSYTTQNGTYTKVGKLITCTFFVQLSAKGTINNDLIITGFPFGFSSGASAAIGYFGNVGVNATYITAHATSTGSTSMYVSYTTAAAATMTVGKTDAVTNTTIYLGSVTYLQV